MSKKVLVNLNMSKNQIENAAAHNLSSAPSNPAVGQEYFNTSDKQKYIWDGTAWVSETGQGTTYTEGTGIDISSNTISVDFTDVATAAQGALADTALQPNTTKYGATFVASLNTTDYKLTMTLKDQDGNTLGTSQVVDFPIESVVIGGSYDNTNKKIILTLQNGNTIDVPVGDLVAGLQSEITSTNKLNADLVDDSTSTNKFVTATDKTTWNNKQDAISDLATIRSGASAGATAAQTYTTTNPALTQVGGVCTWTVTHNLGANVLATVYDATTNEEVIVTVEKTSSTVATVKINSTVNIASGAYRVVVIGK
jgi:hypothetical protein